MLNYLSKFVLQMLPTISATVIGAYIVATWINPKTPREPAKVTAPAAQPAQDVSANPVDAKASAARSAEAANPAKAASVTEKVRVIPIAKSPAQSNEAASADTTDAVATTASVERKDAGKDPGKDANELARAAIQRQRGTEAVTARTSDEPMKPTTPVVRTPPARAGTETPMPVATVAPPLPPAVSIGPPRIAAPGSTDEMTGRLTPPAEIPAARNPLNLQASARVENPSIADDFLSATKSFFRAITPQ